MNPFMTPAPLPAPVQAFAPDFARRFALIMSALMAIVARRLPRAPRLVFLVVPLWTRINRAAQRFARLMARLGAARPSRPPRPGRAAPRPRPPALPTGRGWLVRALGYEVAGCASQLEALLAEPEAVELLAQAPTAGRILRPILGMITLTAVPRKPRAPRAPKPRPVPPPGASPTWPRLIERVPRNYHAVWNWLRTPLNST
jgi:hypothetical protein